MEIRHIHYFITVAENLSITRAARELVITQPSLSRQIRDLERELGTELFRRSAHGLTLTPEGEVFLRYARQITGLVNTAEEHVQELSRGLQGTVRIASVEGQGPRLIAQWIRSFSSGSGKIRFEINSGSSAEIMSLLLDGKADIGLAAQAASAPGLLSVPVFSEPWSVVIPASDPLADQPGHSVSFPSLAGKKLILPADLPEDSSLMTSLSSRNMTQNIFCTVSGFSNAYELVRSGTGIALFPVSDDLPEYGDAVRIKKLSSVHVSYRLIRNRNRRMPHAAELFLRSVCKTVGVPYPE